MSAHSIALLAHASAPLRARLRTFLEQEGFAVIEADCGRNAVALAGQNPIELLVSGMMLPDVHGITLFDRLGRRCRDLSAVCVLDPQESPHQIGGVKRLVVLSTPITEDQFREAVRRLAPFPAAV